MRGFTPPLPHWLLRWLSLWRRGRASPDTLPRHCRRVGSFESSQSSPPPVPATRLSILLSLQAPCLYSKLGDILASDKVRHLLRLWLFDGHAEFQRVQRLDNAAVRQQVDEFASGLRLCEG